MYRNESLIPCGPPKNGTSPSANAGLWLRVAMGLVVFVAAFSGELSAAEQAGAEQATGESLSLNQAIELALDNNLNVVVSRLGTQAQVEGLLSARGAYKPMLSMNVSNSASVSPANKIW